jgi:hypothetical protein
MNERERNAMNAQIWESRRTQIMMATATHITYGLGLRKIQAT